MSVAKNSQKKSNLVTNYVTTIIPEIDCSILPDPVYPEWNNTKGCGGAFKKVDGTYYYDEHLCKGHDDEGHDDEAWYSTCCYWDDSAVCKPKYD